ncbi:MAG: hypothetical protein R6W02_12245, partial [Halomonas campaniensis]
SDSCGVLMYPFFSPMVTVTPERAVRDAASPATALASKAAVRISPNMSRSLLLVIDHDRLVFFGPDQRVLGGWRKAN